jgi:folate-binding protein YgfZ
MADPAHFYALKDTAVLAFRGPEAAQFLQGQLSCDTGQLSAERMQLAGLHNPQGRVLALLRLLQREPGEILALLPRSLALTVSDQLRRYVLRAKVQIQEASAEFQLLGIEAESSEAATESLGGKPLLLESQSGRAYALLPAAMAIDPTRIREDRSRWERLELEAGIPQLTPATSGQFVAQMLNLDLLHAISFTKGCYTGQEVIARAHYRGKVKRRMQRFSTRAALNLAPASSWRLADGRRAQIVQSLPGTDAQVEFLAVAPIVSEGVASEEEAGVSEAGTLECSPLPLPYVFP